MVPQFEQKSAAKFTSFRNLLCSCTRLNRWLSNFGDSFYIGVWASKNSFIRCIKKLQLAWFAQKPEQASINFCCCTVAGFDILLLSSTTTSFKFQSKSACQVASVAEKLHHSETLIWFSQICCKYINQLFYFATCTNTTKNKLACGKRINEVANGRLRRGRLDLRF